MRPGPSGLAAGTPSSSIQPPQPGVYSFQTQGYEDIEGLRRDLPSESQRIVTRDDATTWTYHHIFSDQKEEWYRVTLSDRGIYLLSLRSRVSFGPFNDDTAIRFNPPLLFVKLPFKLGQQWQGTWSGNTSGTYTGHILDQTTIQVGSEDVEAWECEIQAHLQGDIQGQSTIRIWLSPKYGLSVKEYFDEMEQKGFESYHSQGTMAVASVHPRT